MLKDIRSWAIEFNVIVEVLEDDRFLCTPKEFALWAKGRKQLRMEYFYREMRKKYNVLMQGTEPIGNAWNFDIENRKSPKQGLKIPEPASFEIDGITEDVLKIVKERFSDHFGNLLPFYFAVTRLDALKVLEKFIAERLPYFGDYQDAMLEGEPWMYHSHLSFYLNCGLLLPLECLCASYSAVDGFGQLCPYCGS